MKKAEAVKEAQKRGAFFTSPDTVKRTWHLAMEHARRRGFGPGELLWVESSAGGGAFLQGAPEGERLLAFDIHPMAEGIVQQDFLKLRRSQLPDGPFALIGNPPFGMRGSLAAKFINHALIMLGAQFATLVLPGVLAGHFGQRKVVRQVGVVGEPEFVDGEKAFVLPDGRPHAVGACRIITWETMGRRAVRSQSDHPDFRMVSRRPDVDGSRPPDGWGLFIHETQFNGTAQRPGEETEQPAGGFRGTFIYAEPDIIDRLAKIDWGEINRAGCSGKVHHLTRAGIVAAYAAKHGWGTPRRTAKLPPHCDDFSCRTVFTWHDDAPERIAETDWCVAVQSSKSALLYPGATFADFREYGGVWFLIKDKSGNPQRTAERVSALDWAALHERAKHDGNQLGQVSPFRFVAAYEEKYGGASRADAAPNKHPDFECYLAMSGRKDTAGDAARVRIDLGGWHFAVKANSSKMVVAETCSEIYESGGNWLLFYGRAGDPESLLRRLRSLNWSSLSDKAKSDGNPIASINIHHVITAYTARYGAGAPPKQADLFGHKETP